MSQVEFIYNGEKTIIQCQSNEIMKDICQKFRNKINLDKNKAIFYSYNAKIGINEELKFEETANSTDRKRKKMSILVYVTEMQLNKKERDIIKSKNTICPKCKENIKMDIKDYKINLFGCKNNHKIQNILLNEYEATQSINRLEILCNICKLYNKSSTYNNFFYKCDICNKNISPLCLLNHDKSHKVINYDDKYYICAKYNDNYISYCEECKINICSLCEKHKNHKIINFLEISPNKAELEKKLKTLKKFNSLLFIDIIELINILNQVKTNMEIYYKINEDIINNYDNKKKIMKRYII